MFKITIVSLGQTKEKYFVAAIDEYLKRLRPYAKIEIVELKAEPFGASNKAAAQKIEGEKVQNYLEKYLSAHPSVQVFLLDERGEELTSVEFAQKLDKINSEIIFVIGGALGFAPDLLQHYQKFSLSKMTYLHEMAKVVLLEQIYRAVTIIKGKNYHY
jgi:23S rRNA (pseudouridine1915-N3)-methyltransferase